MVDPQRVHAVREAMRAQLATALFADWEQAYEQNRDTGAYQPDPVSSGRRALAGIAQFLWLLFAGEANSQIAQFGNSLSRWLADAARYLSCASDMKPFPWAPWPPAQ